MRKTKNFNIQVPELGDVPDITQVSNAIQDLEDALAGTLEIMDASIQGSKLTLKSVSRQTKRTKYYDGMSVRFLCPQTISANTLKTVVVDDLPKQVISINFDIVAGKYVDITYRGTSFTAHPVMIQKSESIDSNSNETVATSKAVKKVNDKVNTVSDEVNKLDKNKENAFSKKSGFNLDKTDNVTNDTNKLFTAKGGNNLFEMIQGNSGIKFDKNLIFLNDIGEKKKGNVYLDRLQNGTFECIQTTTLTVNNSSYFKNFSNNELSNRLDNLYKIESFEHFNYGINLKAIKLGNIVFLSVTQSIAQDPVIDKIKIVKLPNNFHPLFNVTFTTNAVTNSCLNEILIDTDGEIFFKRSGRGLYSFGGISYIAQS